MSNVHFHDNWWEYHSLFLLSYRKIEKQACFLICGHKTRKQNIAVEAKFSYFFYLPNKSFLCKYKLQRLQDNFTSDFIQYYFKIGNVTRPEILVLWLSQIWNYERLKIIPNFSIKARKSMSFWSCDGHKTRKFFKINELSLNMIWFMISR